MCVGDKVSHGVCPDFPPKSGTPSSMKNIPGTFYRFWEFDTNGTIEHERVQRERIHKPMH